VDRKATRLPHSRIVGNTGIYSRISRIATGPGATPRVWVYFLWPCIHFQARCGQGWVPVLPRFVLVLADFNWKTATAAGRSFVALNRKPSPCPMSCSPSAGFYLTWRNRMDGRKATNVLSTSATKSPLSITFHLFLAAGEILGQHSSPWLCVFPFLPLCDILHEDFCLIRGLTLP